MATTLGGKTKDELKFIIVPLLNDSTENRKTKGLLLFEQFLREHEREIGFRTPREIMENYAASNYEEVFWEHFISQQNRHDTLWKEFIEQEKALATTTIRKKDFLEEMNWLFDNAIIKRKNLNSYAIFKETGLVNFLWPIIITMRKIIVEQEKSFTEKSKNACYTIINQFQQVNKVNEQVTPEDVEPIIQRVKEAYFPTPKTNEETQATISTGGDTTSTSGQPTRRNNEANPTASPVQPNTENRGDSETQQTAADGDVIESNEDNVKNNWNKFSESFKDLLKGAHHVVKRKYYYTWWIFDNRKDFETVQQDHKYPRNRGKFKVSYAEVPTKEIADALSGGLDGNKGYSSVNGDFLGAMGLTTRKTPFTSTLQYSEAFRQALIAANEGKKEGDDAPVIALGTARAKAMSWRANEIRGIFPGGKMRFDISKLNWKWAEWKGTANIKGELTITVAITDKETYDQLKAQQKTKELFENPALRLKDAKATLTLPGKEEIKEAKEGLAIFEKVPHGLEVSIKGYKKEYGENTSIEPPSPFTIQDHQDVIVALEKRTGPTNEPEFILLPVTSPDEKHRQLDNPFGRKNKITLPNIPVGNKIEDKARGNEYSFQIHKEKSRPLAKAENIWYEVFILHFGDNKLITPNTNKVTVVSNGNNHGSFHDSIPTMKKEWTTSSNKKAEVITPSFDCDDKFIEGKYRIYCLAKKKETLFSSFPNNHQSALIADAYHGIPEKERLLWDYNYIDFTVGGTIEKNITPAVKKKPEQAQAEAVNAVSELEKHAKGKKNLPLNQAGDFSFLWTERNNIHLFEDLNKDITAMLPSKTPQMQALGKDIRTLLEAKVAFDKAKKGAEKKGTGKQLTAAWSKITGDYSAFITGSDFTFSNVLKLVNTFINAPSASLNQNNT